MWKFPYVNRSKNQQRINVHLEDWAEGSFTVPPVLNIKPGDWALFYLRKQSGKRGNRIIAVDRIIFGKSSLIAFRVLGDPNIVVPVEGVIDLIAVIEPVKPFFKKAKIFVVKEKGERFFKCGKLLFDSLNAYSIFHGGMLTLIRNGEIVEQTKGIEYWGSHGRSLCFVFEDPLTGIEQPRLSIEAQECRVGDVLVLQMPMKDIDLEQELRKHWLGIMKLRLFVVTLGSVSQEAASLIAQKDPKEIIKTLEKAAKDARVLRFRQDPKDFIQED